jgi:quinol monooxygenase YgiN
MIVVAGWLRVRPEDRDAYVAGCREAVRAAREAPGCLDFAVSADPLATDRVNVHERWRARADLERFRGSGPDDAQRAQLLAVHVAEYDVAQPDPPARVDDPDLPAAVGGPARRALAGAGFDRLRDLTGVPERDLLRLHGVGPRAVGVLRAALAEQGWRFAP